MDRSQFSSQLLKMLEIPTSLLSRVQYQNVGLMTIIAPEYKAIRCKTGVNCAWHLSFLSLAELPAFYEQIKQEDKKILEPRIRSLFEYPLRLPVLIPNVEANWMSSKYCVPRLEKEMEKLKRQLHQEHLLSARLNKKHLDASEQEDQTEVKTEKQEDKPEKQSDEQEKEVQSSILQKQEQEQGPEAIGGDHVVRATAPVMPRALRDMSQQFAVLNIIPSINGRRLYEGIFVNWGYFPSKKEADEWVMEILRSNCPASKLPNWVTVRVDTPIDLNFSLLDQSEDIIGDDSEYVEYAKSRRQKYLLQEQESRQNTS